MSNSQVILSRSEYDELVSKLNDLKKEKDNLIEEVINNGNGIIIKVEASDRWFYHTISTVEGEGFFRKEVEDIITELFQSRPDRLYDLEDKNRELSESNKALQTKLWNAREMLDKLTLSFSEYQKMKESIEELLNKKSCKSN
jgi:hypothetical protein